MKVIIVGEITTELCKDVMRQLTEGMLKDEIVEVYVNSIGGELEHAFAIYDMLMRMPNHVHVHVVGSCCSAAPLIVLAGDIRTTAPHTQWMMHTASLEELTGTLAEIAVQVELAKRLMDRYAAVLSLRTEMPKRHWADIFRAQKDRWFTAKEACTWGLVTTEQ